MCIRDRSEGHIIGLITFCVNGQFVLFAWCEDVCINGNGVIFCIFAPFRGVQSMRIAIYRYCTCLLYTSRPGVRRCRLRGFCGFIIWHTRLPPEFEHEKRGLIFHQAPVGWFLLSCQMCIRDRPSSVPCFR